MNSDMRFVLSQPLRKALADAWGSKMLSQELLHKISKAVGRYASSCDAPTKQDLISAARRIKELSNALLEVLDSPPGIAVTQALSVQAHLRLQAATDDRVADEQRIVSSLLASNAVRDALQPFRDAVDVVELSYPSEGVMVRPSNLIDPLSDLLFELAVLHLSVWKKLPKRISRTPEGSDSKRPSFARLLEAIGNELKLRNGMSPSTFLRKSDERWPLVRSYIVRDYGEKYELLMR